MTFVPATAIEPVRDTVDVFGAATILNEPFPLPERVSAVSQGADPVVCHEHPAPAVTDIFVVSPVAGDVWETGLTW